MEPLAPLYSVKSHSNASGYQAYKTVASFEGGGVRAIIPARICQTIEEYTRRAMVDLYDDFAGTSGGAIVATALNVPKAPGSNRPKHSAEDIVEFMREKADAIFPILPWYRRPDQFLASLFTSKYSPEGLNKTLEEQYGDVLLSQSLKNIIIPVAHLSNKNTDPWLFARDTILKNSPEPFNQEAVKNIRMADVLKATCSAPYYFPFATIHIEQKPFDFMDGGTFANNPVLVSLSYAKVLYPSQQALLVSSFGTGKPVEEKPMPSPYNMGAIFWLANYPVKSMELNDGEAKLQAAIELNYSDSPKDIHYFQPEISPDDYTLDDSTQAHLERLLNATEVYIDKNKEKIKKFCQHLLKNLDLKNKESQLGLMAAQEASLPCYGQFWKPRQS